MSSGLSLGRFTFGETELLESTVEEFVWVVDPVYVPWRKETTPTPQEIESHFLGHSAHSFVNVLAETYLTYRQYCFKYYI